MRFSRGVKSSCCEDCVDSGINCLSSVDKEWRSVLFSADSEGLGFALFLPWWVYQTRLASIQAMEALRGSLSLRASMICARPVIWA